jgi:hypothetical protein
VDDFIISNPIETHGVETGTEVSISNLFITSDVLLNSCIRQDFAKKFAIYLTEYPDLNLLYDGFKINPDSVINYRQDYPLGDIDLGNW